MCLYRTLYTCEKADDQADGDDYDAAECTVPHVGQWIKSLQCRRSTKEQRRKDWFVEPQQQKCEILAGTSLWHYWVQPEWWQQWGRQRHRVTGWVCSQTGAERCWRFVWRCSRYRSKRPEPDQPPNPPLRPGTQKRILMGDTWLFKHHQTKCTDII